MSETGPWREEMLYQLLTASTDNLADLVSLVGGDSRTYFEHADFRGKDLRGINLDELKLGYALADEETLFDEGFQEIQRWLIQNNKRVIIPRIFVERVFLRNYKPNVRGSVLKHKLRSVFFAMEKFGNNGPILMLPSNTNKEKIIVVVNLKFTGDNKSFTEELRLHDAGTRRLMQISITVDEDHRLCPMFDEVANFDWSNFLIENSYFVDENSVFIKSVSCFDSVLLNDFYHDIFSKEKFALFPCYIECPNDEYNFHLQVDVKFVKGGIFGEIYDKINSFFFSDTGEDRNKKPSLLQFRGGFDIRQTEASVKEIRESVAQFLYPSR